MQNFFTQPVDIVLFRKGRNVTRHSLFDFFTLPEFSYLHNLHIYAVFSHTAYCTIVDGYAEDKGIRVELPEGWELMQVLTEIENKPGSIDIEGLKYLVWKNALKNKVVIAFRGTRFTSWRDWYANLNFVTRFVPGIRNHYGKLTDFIPDFVTEVQTAMGSDVQIISTGHSLGGGLAQYASYLSPHINLVYGFAPSPVTGFRSVDKQSRVTNQENTLIARIFEHGEVLAYLRFFLKKIVRLSIQHPEINEVRFNFSNANAISEHSMGKLAEHIIDRSPNIDNEKNYSSIA